MCNWIGDVVMNLPALQAIRHHEPDAEIIAITRSWVEDILFFRRDLVNEVQCFDDRKGPVSFYRFARDIRALAPQVGFTFLNHIKGALLLYLAGIPQRVGFGNRETKLFLNRSLERHDLPDGRHFNRDYLDLVALSGYGMEAPPRPRLDRDPELESLIRARLIGNDLGPILAVQAGAAFGTAKRWFPERIAEVCRRFIDREGGTVILLGSEDERDLNETISTTLPLGHLRNLVGKTSLRESMSVISMADTFLSGDSGLAHVAAAFSVPQIAIFGPTDPERSYPDSPRAEILYEDLSCSPCFARHCPLEHHGCMDAITIDRVDRAIQRARARVAP